MNEEIERSYNTSANGFDVKASALKIRLDSTSVLENLEMYLSSTMIKVYKNDETGEIFQKRVPFGDPKANETGIQNILAIVSSILNAQIVQGNWVKYEDFENYICELNLVIAKAFMVSLDDWEIKEENYNLIVDQIMLTLIPFLTRLISNKERESYGETLKTVETARITDETNKGGFKLFGGKE